MISPSERAALILKCPEVEKVFWQLDKALQVCLLLNQSLKVTNVALFYEAIQQSKEAVE